MTEAVRSLLDKLESNPRLFSLVLTGYKAVLHGYTKRKMKEIESDPMVWRDGSWIFLSPRDESVSYRTYMGWYERHVTKLFLDLLPSTETVVDVGANIGYYALMAARAQKRVFAFEPEPFNFSLLEKSVKKDGFTNVSLHNICLSDEDGWARLFLTTSKNAGLHSIVKRVGPESIRVPCARLDSIFPKETIDLMKVDAEYAEVKIIAGAERLISEGRVNSIILEWTPEIWHSHIHLLRSLKATDIGTGKPITDWSKRATNLYLQKSN